MTPQELKASILQLAFQGKLTTQNVNDLDVEQTLNACKEEKKRAILEGKIRNEKFRGAIVEHEYDVPDTWRVLYISDMALFQEGPGILAVDFRTTGIPLIRISGMQTSRVSLDGCNFLDPAMVENKWKHFQLDLGDILISTSASMDKVCEVFDDCVGAIPYTGQIRFKMYAGISKEYFKWFVQSPFYIKQIIDQQAGAAIKHYGPTHLKKMTIPLAPIEEQRRIVEKIEELLPYIDRYEQAWSKLENFNKRFPVDMQKSILQMAIQGKLVPQLPEEGTGEELFQQIQAEKQRLIKAGTIKKEKPLPEIAEDEIPFDIPDSWKWIKLGDVASVLGGKRIPAGRTLTTDNTGHKYIRVSDMKKGSVLTDNLLYVRADIYPSISRYVIHKEDVYITVAGTIGRVGKIPPEIDGANLTENADRLVFKIIDQDWLIKCLESSLVQQQIIDATTKVGQPKLAIKRIQELLIPLPPLAEQKRIVAKLEEILPLCERLK